MLEAATVMIVEDDLLLLLDLEDILLDAGFKVAPRVKSADDARSIPLAHHVDMVLMDIDLWGEEGEGIRIGRDLWERHSVRSLYVSGNLNAERRATAEAAAPLGFIDKPCPPDWVLACLRAGMT